jgi:hypothetical protein
MVNGKHELVGLGRVETPKTFILGPLVSVVISHVDLLDLLARQSAPPGFSCENLIILLICIS